LNYTKDAVASALAIYLKNLRMAERQHWEAYEMAVERQLWGGV